LSSGGNTGILIVVAQSSIPAVSTGSPAKA
jgi:hypothetical protein